MSRMMTWSVGCSGPDAYERYIVAAWMGAWAQKIIEYAAIKPDERILDLACGTGIVARKAAAMIGENGSVTGADFDCAMLDAAKRFAEKEERRSIHWQQADASCLSFADTQFDLILCQQGLQFFQNQNTALREMHRALAIDGRILLSVWCALDRQPFLNAMSKVLGKYLGNSSTTIFTKTCSLFDCEILRALVSRAGFDNIHIRRESIVARYPSAEEMIRGYISVFPQSALIAAMPSEKQDAIFEELINMLRVFGDDNGLAVPTESLLLTAVRRNTSD